MHTSPGKTRLVNGSRLFMTLPSFSGNRRNGGPKCLRPPRPAIGAGSLSRSVSPSFLLPSRAPGCSASSGCPFADRRDLRNEPFFPLLAGAERDAGLFGGPKKLKFDQMFRRGVLFRGEIRRSRLERSLQYRAANRAPEATVAIAIVNLRIILPPPMIAHATPMHAILWLHNFHIKRLSYFEL